VTTVMDDLDNDILSAIFPQNDLLIKR